MDRETNRLVNLRSSIDWCKFFLTRLHYYAPPPRIKTLAPVPRVLEVRLLVAAVSWEYSRVSNVQGAWFVLAQWDAT